MGLGSLLHDITNGVTLGGMDMSILSTIALPDPEAQEKYAAMGLPDPVAFAALTALGAIPNPMGMLNAMMMKAEKRIAAEALSQQVAPQASPLEAAPDPDARLPSSNDGADGSRPEAPPVKFKLPGMAEGKSFVEAFKDLEKSKEGQQRIRSDEDPTSATAASGYIGAAQRMVGQQEEHLAKQAREVSEQAKVAASRAREVAHGAAQSVALGAVSLTSFGVTADVKGVAQAFNFSADDDAAGKPAAQTLSALLGSQGAMGALGADGSGGYALGSPAIDKICISRLPKGVTDATIRLECARHGAVTSVILQGDGSAAYVTYANAEMAANAMRRILARPSALGSTESLEVHLIGEIPENVRLASDTLAPEVELEAIDPSELPEYLRPKEDTKKNKRSKSRQKSRSRSRRKKRSKSKRSKSRSKSKKKRRGRKRSKSRDRWLDRSRSHSHTATGQYIRATGFTSSVRPWEKKKRSSSSSRSRPRKEPAVEDKRPRQVAVKGPWAHFTFKGNSYYYNIVSGHTQWEYPKDFEAPSSRRAFSEAPAAGAQNLQTLKSATGCLL